MSHALGWRSRYLTCVMGWLRNTRRQSKEAFIDELLSNFSSDELIKHSVRGNNLWVLYNHPTNGTPLIGLFLMNRVDGCWGYRILGEIDGPLQYDCPLSFLQAAPEPQGCNLNHLDSGESWRDFVRSYHEGVRNRTHLKVGDVVTLDATLYPDHQRAYKVTECLGRKGYMLDGYLRLKCRQVRHVSVVG